MESRGMGSHWPFQAVGSWISQHEFTLWEWRLQFVLNMAIEILCFPINHGDFPISYVNLCRRLHGLNLFFFYFKYGVHWGLNPIINHIINCSPGDPSLRYFYWGARVANTLWISPCPLAPPQESGISVSDGGHHAKKLIFYPFPHRKTTGKWWFNAIWWDLPSGELI